ncbi:MAG: hypothetical protein AAF620_15235 [Bacteroidota bacterium]
MKIKHNNVQREIGFCSPLLLSNIFNDDSFLKYLDREEFHGSGEEQWDEMIEDWNRNLKIEELAYVSSNYGAISPELIWKIVNYEVFPEVSDFPVPICYYFLTVRLVKDIWHSVAILQSKGGLWYSDPFNEYMYKIDDIYKFMRIAFIDCSRVQALFIKETDQMAYLNGEDIFGSRVIHNFKKN